ncbi:MAG: IS3 family transposase, partial [Bacteroidaceae bacterium]|nr:IS3 family transposase [Bacteroidaceae bacterium]
MVKENHEEHGYPVDQCCRILQISRAAYYKWATGKISPREAENKRIADIVEEIHEKHPEMGYRRLKDELDRRHETHANDKRVLRICRSLRIKSTIKYRNRGCTRQGKNPYYLADNRLNREFKAEKPNEKWLTDITEFKYYVGLEKKKLYLSAILDLYDRRIVSYVIRDTNDTPLVFETFKAAMAAEPNAHPLFHSDRGFQYTNRVFHDMLVKAGMTQSMSRVARCI